MMTQTLTAKYCTSCGRGLQTEWTFCPVCGTSAAVDDEVGASNQPAPPSANQTGLRSGAADVFSEAASPQQAASCEDYLARAEVLLKQYLIDECSDCLLEATQKFPTDGRLRIF